MIMVESHEVCLRTKVQNVQLRALSRVHMPLGQANNSYCSDNLEVSSLATALSISGWRSQAQEKSYSLFCDHFISTHRSTGHCDLHSSKIKPLWIKIQGTIISFYHLSPTPNTHDVYTHWQYPKALFTVRSHCVIRLLIQKVTRASMVAQGCHPSLQEAEAEDSEL